MMLRSRSEYAWQGNVDEEPQPEQEGLEIQEEDDERRKTKMVKTYMEDILIGGATSTLASLEIDYCYSHATTI